MQIESIPFSDTKSFSKLFADYTSDSVNLEQFVSVFPSESNILSLTDKIDNQNINRQALASSLKKQYESSGIYNEETARLIESLKDTNTYTVTTGHQLQLAGGPLFFTFKILTTIKLAEELSSKSGKKFIPVFWLASEDHDIDEINNIVLFENELKWDADVTGTPISGSLTVKGLHEFFEQVFALIKGSKYEEDFKELISQTYFHSTSGDLSSATRLFVHHLFKDFPLLVIDANDVLLKSSFTSVLLDEVENGFSQKEAEKMTSALEAAGYSGQASIRDLNLFYINGNNRERIDRTGRTFKTINASKEWDLTSIKEEIEQHPERFSPNVVLRPVYQQCILPNVAYIGGPAEVAYWLQLKGVFEKSKVTFPAIIARNSAMIIEHKLLDKIHKLGLRIHDLFEEEELAVKNYVLMNSESIDLSEEKERISSDFESIINKAESTDPTLKPSAEAELKKILNSLDAFQAKLLRAEKHKQEQAVNQIRKTKHKLFPGGSLAERQETIIPYYIKYGPGFIKELYNVMTPVPCDFKVIVVD